MDTPADETTAGESPPAGHEVDQVRSQDVGWRADSHIDCSHSAFVQEEQVAEREKRQCHSSSVPRTVYAFACMSINL